MKIKEAREDLRRIMKEIDLIRSYFENTTEVVLHKNDFNFPKDNSALQFYLDLGDRDLVVEQLSD
jgi:hypothetical protein